MPSGSIRMERKRAMPDPVVLVIEDEKSIVNYMKTILSTQSYRVIETRLGREGLSLAASHSPELILLDLGLPDMDGVEFIKMLRGWSSIPVVVVTARGQEQDHIEALDAGADDYLVKPFRTGELLARMRALLRRAGRPSDDFMGTDAEHYECGPLSVDVGKRRVFMEGQEIHLTPIEYRILLVFLRQPGRVLTHRYLQAQVWGQANPDQFGNVRVFVSTLRRKIQGSEIQSPMIKTEIGVGYRFEEDAGSTP